MFSPATKSCGAFTKMVFKRRIGRFFAKSLLVGFSAAYFYVDAIAYGIRTFLKSLIKTIPQARLGGL